MTPGLLGGIVFSKKGDLKMAEETKNKKRGIKAFFSGLFNKMDKKLEEKSKTGGCCGTKGSSKGGSCCSQ